MLPPILEESFLNSVLSIFFPSVSDKFLDKSVFTCACRWLFAKSKTPKNIIDFKIPIQINTSFVLPVISHPYEYSGFTFQLLVQRNKKKSEYDILASGGRYDKLVYLNFISSLKHFL